MLLRQRSEREGRGAQCVTAEGAAAEELCCGGRRG